MSQNIQSVRGMNDILPGEAEFWEVFEETVRSWLKSYGYRPIRLPIVELRAGIDLHPETLLRLGGARSSRRRARRRGALLHELDPAVLRPAFFG